MSTGLFSKDNPRAAECGRKGGQNPNNRGRFDNNKERAREAGRKGGLKSQEKRHAVAQHMNEVLQKMDRP